MNNPSSLSTMSQRCLASAAVCMADSRVCWGSPVMKKRSKRLHPFLKALGRVFSMASLVYPLPSARRTDSSNESGENSMDQPRSNVRSMFEKCSALAPLNNSTTT